MKNRLRILALFAKWPAPGEVKTRLAAATTPEFATEAADAFLDDALERWGSYSARRILAFTPPSAADGFTFRAHGQWELVPQTGGDLGQRMRSFFQQHHAGSSDSHIVLVGTDSPTLPIHHVNQAFSALDESDLVLGPATDGGYYLLGGAATMPYTIFDGIEYGRNDVLEKTLARLPATTRVALLPPWYDVDTLDDWQMLCGHIAAMRRTGVDPQAPRTEALCER